MRGMVDRQGIISKPCPQPDSHCRRTSRVSFRFWRSVEVRRSPVAIYEQQGRGALLTFQSTLVVSLKNRCVVVLKAVPIITIATHSLHRA